MKNVRLFLALAVAVLLGACTSSPKEWEDVTWLHSTTNLIAIEHVEYTDTATILTIHETHTPGRGMRISPSTRLIGDKNKEYRILGGEDITIGETFVTPESGEAHFKLLFEPMPERTSHFDYIEGYNYGDFRIYGLHTPLRPIKVPTYKHRIAEEEIAEGFLRTDTIRIRGKVEGYSRDMGFNALHVYHTNTLTRESSPTYIYINDDGSFEGAYIGSHPKFETMCFEGSKRYKIMSIYTVPGCTTELYLDKEGNLKVSSPDKEVLACKRMVEEEIFSLIYCSYYERTESMSRLELDEYIAFIDKKEAAYDKLARYIAWKYKFTPTEQYYMWLNGKVEYLHNLFEYDCQSISPEGYVVYDSIALEFDTYKCLHDMPYNSVACLAIGDYDFAINRYEYSPIIQKDIFKPGLKALDYIVHQDTSKVRNDMKVMGASEPTLLSSIILLRDVLPKFEYLRNNHKEDLATFAEQRKALLIHPFLKSELDRLYAKELKALKPSWTLPEGEATEILRRMTDKYRGKYLLIDFWDMSCSPCRQGIERSKEMRKAFRDHPEVDFLFIASPTSTQEAYDAYVKENLDGEDCHLISRDEFNKLMQLFKFIGIPHYETLDKEGNVLNKCLEFDTPEAFAEQLRKIKESER